MKADCKLQWVRRFVCFGVIGIGTITYRSAEAEQPISLAGPWRFSIADTNAQGFSHKLPGTIYLAGTMDDAGLGPKNTNAPILEGPYRLHDYAGSAWYQRDIEIPVSEAGIPPLMQSPVEEMPPNYQKLTDSIE
jgi:hypothetical protein